MKLILMTALTTTIASAAFAGNSDRYNDQRFDSAVGHVSSFDRPHAEAAVTTTRPLTVTFATNNGSGKQDSGSYAYANPYGVGPDNDSR